MNYRIHNQRMGLSLSGNDGESLLQTMRRHGSRWVPIGCLGGGCGLCKVKILDGEYQTKKMSKKHITASDERQRNALACRVFPCGDLHFEVK